LCPAANTMKGNSQKAFYFERSLTLQTRSLRN
jgi:hypothetical protein